ncbi:MAG: YfiR family protein [Porphyrobacter sp.]|nr:YfiR family protein [Porphyrobacter sp.]
MSARLPFLPGVVSLMLAILLAPCAAPAAAATPEAEVKAAYLYKLASFVRWPGGGDVGGPFRVCVAGRSDVAAVLDQLVRGQQVAGRAITVEQLTSAQADRARGCQVLFLGRGAATAHALFSATHGLPVLTVGDRNNGTGGGVVDFLFRDGRVRLAIDRGAADDHHLELSSKLLDVAVAVDR